MKNQDRNSAEDLHHRLSKTDSQRIADLKVLIELYCLNNCKDTKGAGSTSTESQTGALCNSCQALLDYSIKRLSKCPLKDRKPPCSKCEIHCYSNKYREHIRRVMRYSGPRVLFYKPAVAKRHLVESLKHHSDKLKKSKEN